MVGIHIDANYIFCETMKNRTEREMITAYQKMVDRMEIAGTQRPVERYHLQGWSYRRHHLQG
jgi:hypothetical protein